MNSDEENEVLEPALDLEQAQIRAIQMCATIFGERPIVSEEFIYSVDCRYKIPKWTLSCEVPTTLGSVACLKVKVGPFESLLACIHSWNEVARDAKKALFTEDLIGERKVKRC